MLVWDSNVSLLSNSVLLLATVVLEEEWLRQKCNRERNQTNCYCALKPSFLIKIWISKHLTVEFDLSVRFTQKQVGYNPDKRFRLSCVSDVIHLYH